MLVTKEILPFGCEAFLAALSVGKTNLEFPADAEIYAQGSPADSIYFVLKGMVKITTATSGGKEAVLAIVGPHNFFGDGCLTSFKQRRASIRAIENTSVIRLDTAALQRALRDDPSFSRFFIGYLIDERIRTEFSLVDQLINSSEQRLARALLQITEVGVNDAPRTIGLKISQDTLADLVGTTRSRISFFMNKFRRLGFIETKGHLRVHRELLSTVLGDR